MTALNVALLATQRLSDAANGGGEMTSNIIPDNQADNLFLDISREDHTAGRVNLRKAMMMALSADTKVYLGAHAIISAPPADADVSVCMFDPGGTDAWTNVRTDARDFIESYLVQGPAMQCWLYGTHVAGQRSILIFQKPDRPLPSIGDTIVLDDTTTDPEDIQFLRIASIHDRGVQTFTDSVGDFSLRVITVDISAPLAFRFAGAQPQRYSTPPSPTLICQTTVADAAKYYGVTKPTLDIDAGSVDATVDSIFGQLVPATQSEVPITDASPQGVQAIVPAGPSQVSLAAWSFTSSARTWNTERAMAPGTVKVAVMVGGSISAIVAIDDGAGIMHAGTTTTGTQVGTVDYNGSVTLTTNVTGGAEGAIFAIPAAVVTQSPYTKQQPVTEGTRGYVYVDTLDPVPNPGSLVVSYRSQGSWYDLTDDGSGTLAGATGAGTGVVRFDSGSVNVTLGALPDIGSNVIFAWGQAVQYDIRTADVDIQIPAVSLTLSQPAKPSSITITYVVGVTTKTIADDGSGGLNGDGTGTVVYGAGILTFRPTALPSSITGFAVAYDNNPQTVQNLTPSKSGSTISFTLSAAPIAPRSVLIRYNIVAPSTYLTLFGGNPNIARTILDDGAGGLVAEISPGSFSTIVGSVNYTTGVVSFNPDLSAILSTPVYQTFTQTVYDSGSHSGPPPTHTVTYTQMVGWTNSTVTAPFVDGSAVTVASTAASASSSAQSENFPAPGIKIDLTPTTVEPIVPGSILFTYAGNDYIDRSGILYRSFSPTTAAAVNAGTVDYITGHATITDWTTAGAQTLTVKSLLAEHGVNPIAFLTSRVPGPSVRPASFSIRANRKSDGALITATADINGDWSTADMTGRIETSTGFYTVQFGQTVADSSFDWLIGSTYTPGDLKRKSGIFYDCIATTTGDDPSTDAGVHWKVSSQPWYDSDNIDGSGNIWWPNEALAGTVRYSCVVDSFLPLDPAILGIDPVRLPLDGRVPITRAGDTLVFREPLTYTLTNPLVASHTYSLPRDGLEDVVLYDQLGVAVDTANYTTDPTAGTVTTTSGMDLSSYTQPIVAVHTRADMVLCVDAQITGQISWNRPLTNAYPAASSYVSSALIAGDLQAQYSNLFTQVTWNLHPATLWEDVVQGTNTTAAFDDVTYPIEVIDRDCITQRWALIFTSATAFNIVGEHKGVIATGNTSTNVAPINGATGNPYFVINHLGFGGGWSTGNAIRFNTTGAGKPIWFARTTLAGAAVSTEDKFSTQLRWDE